MRKLIALSALLAAMPGALHAGSFGLDIVMDLGRFEDRTQEDEIRWMTMDVVPQPHELFSVYQVMYSEETGICEIRAATEPYHDPAGAKARLLGTKLASSLSAKYGEYESVRNDILPGSILKGPLQWARSVQVGERTYRAHLRNEEVQKIDVDQMTLFLSSFGGDPLDTVRVLLSYGNPIPGSCIKSRPIQAKEIETSNL